MSKPDLDKARIVFGDWHLDRCHCGGILHKTTGIPGVILAVCFEETPLHLTYYVKHDLANRIYRKMEGLDNDVNDTTKAT